jgi:hypothetical protein
MSIREEENKLFEKWHKKYETESFVIDGCPNPDIYIQEDRKVVFVLKDANLGEPDKGNKYDQRNELENEPHIWWNTIAKWCYFLKTPSATWALSQNTITDQLSIKAALSHHCFVQLKKTWGKGTVANEKLADAVLNDKNEILSQLTIYEPDFIIACGNGDQLSKVFNCNHESHMETSAGVGYWKLELNHKTCYLIDYCHPSIRVGTKVKGIIAKGLAFAILEIEKNT